MPIRMVLGFTLSLLAGVLILDGCSSSSSTPSSTSNTGPSEDTSASGIAASAVGGTINSTNSTPSMGRIDHFRFKNPLLMLLDERRAFASNYCPTLLTANGSGCSNTSSTELTLTYSNCSFPNSTAVFSGSDLVETPGGLTCGTYPTVPNNDYLAHQYVGTRTTSSGTVVNINGENGNNYTGTSTTSTGEATFFTNGARNSVVIYGVRYTSTGKFDHTVGQYQSTGLTLATSGSTYTVNGSLNVYHNLERVTGTVAFTNVVYSAACCQPTGGSISTSFTVGTNGNSSSAYAGKTETLAFSGTCGQGTYTSISGVVSTVTLPHCL